MTTGCWHCGEALPVTGARAAVLDGEPRVFCCTGCAAAARWIVDAGLGDYYRVRAAAGARAEDDASLADWDLPAVQAGVVRAQPGRRDVVLPLSGMHCAACGWLVEQALRRCAGVLEARANPGSGRLALAWDPGRTTLSTLLGAIAPLGYRAHRPDPRAEDAARVRERRQWFKRLAVAGLGAMQSMMFAEALWFGAGTGMDAATRDGFRWIGLLVAAPVVYYAGWPFLRGALTELRLRRPGMDLLVALSVQAAYLGSVVETLRGGSVVYFDAAVMFVFFLLAARAVERGARLRAGDALALLARASPAVARRRDPDGGWIEVAVEALAPGDVVRMRAGETVPADGVLLDEAAEFDEALISGESRAVRRGPGEAVIAGSLVLAQPATLRVTAIGADTALGRLRHRVGQAAAARPRALARADRLATGFVVAMLALTAATVAIWLAIDAPRAWPVALALLAATCPCAFAIAWPAALAAAQARLARDGILVLDADALPALARIDTVVFDKTGTLSAGRPRLARIDAPERDREALLAVAAALERDVRHPLAAAFRPHDRGLAAEDVHSVAGAGIRGRVGGVAWRLGTRAFALGANGTDDGAVVLARDGAEAARFAVEDPLRPAPAAACAALRARGLALELASGDAPAPVAAAAAALGIPRHAARLLPEAKLARVRALQAEGRVVAMVGDGSNDAPVLAGADVSVALASGTDIAHAAAGVLLVDGGPERLPLLLDAARRTRAVVRQNLVLALLWNGGALPLAALDVLPPWAAALGMVLSSLAVTFNALRLARAPRDARPERAAGVGPLREVAT